MTEQPAMSNGMASRARPEILAMKGYASARSLVESGGSTVFLDANECPYEPFVGASGLARYPMQQPPELLSIICDWLDLSSRNVTVMRGADEAIDTSAGGVNVLEHLQHSLVSSSVQWTEESIHASRDGCEEIGVR